MTKKELLINIKWDEFEMGTCRVFVETLNPLGNNDVPTLIQTGELKDSQLK